jgi:intraflagellar transport protein 88
LRSCSGFSLFSVFEFLISGLCNKKLARLEDALDSFYKLHAILRNSAQVMYQIADIYDQLEDTPQATEWLMQLLGIVPTDASILQKLGEVYDNEGDKSQAFQYHYDVSFS